MLARRSSSASCKRAGEQHEKTTRKPALNPSLLLKNLALLLEQLVLSLGTTRSLAATRVRQLSLRSEGYLKGVNKTLAPLVSATVSEGGALRFLRSWVSGSVSAEGIPLWG